MAFRIVYILFLLSSMTLGSIYIGPVTFRQLFALIMLILCFKKTSRVLMDTSLTFFVAFSFIFGITSILHGFFNDYFRFIVGHYFVAIIGFWSTVIAYREGNVKDFFHAFVVLVMFDALITILQAFGNPLAMTIGAFFSPIEVEQMSKSLIEGDFVSFSLSGIFGATTNGYYLLVASIMSLFYIFDYKHILKFVPFAICFIGSFFCQQRTPFFVNCIFIVFFIIKIFNSLTAKYKVLLLMGVCIGVVFLIPWFIEFSTQNDMRYLSLGTDSTGRDKIYQNAITYINQNYISANIFEFRRIYGHSPHMLIYNMFIYGGIFGFLCLAITLFIQIIKTIKVILTPLTKENSLLFLASGAFLAFTANSITHNTSIVTGDVLVWVLWGYVIAASDFRNYTKNRSIA